MPDVLKPDALEKLTHYAMTSFIKCSNRTLVMSDVLGPDALGKLKHYDIFISV